MMLGNGSIMRTRRAEPGLAASKGLGLAAWIRALFVCLLAGSLAFSTTLPAVAAQKQKQSDLGRTRIRAAADLAVRLGKPYSPCIN